MSYDNTNRGSIWKNEKRPGKKDPDYRIEFNLDGQDFKVAIWKRAEDANPAAPPWSFKIDRPQQSITEQALAKVRRPDQITSGRSLHDEIDDDIPF